MCPSLCRSSSPSLPQPVTVIPLNPAAIHAVRPHAGQSFSHDFFNMLFDLALTNATAPLPPDHLASRTITHHHKAMSKAPALCQHAWWSYAHRPISPSCTSERQSLLSGRGRSKCLLHCLPHRRTTRRKENGALRSVVWLPSRSHRFFATSQDCLSKARTKISGPQISEFVSRAIKALRPAMIIVTLLPNVASSNHTSSHHKFRDTLR